MSTTVEKVCGFWMGELGEDSELVDGWRDFQQGEREIIKTRITEANVFLV